MKSQRTGLATRILWGVVIGSLVLALVFALTHGIWYDRLTPEQHVQFWNEFFVAYGTLALGIVTWGSVRESQDVLAGEELRFRQARMPMVAASQAYRKDGGVFLALRNSGDAPARNVRVTYDAHTVLKWNDQGTVINRDKIDETDVTVSRELWSSFLPVGLFGECDRTFGAKPEVQYAMSPESSVVFRKLVIEYEDVFGAVYVTAHAPNIGGHTIPLRFTWNPPAELLP